MTEFAYALNGTHVPFGSKDAYLCIQVRKRGSGHELIVRAERLPLVTYFSDDGLHMVGYLPDSIRLKVETDLGNIGLSSEEIRFHLPQNEISARRYATTMEESHKGNRRVA